MSNNSNRLFSAVIGILFFFSSTSHGKDTEQQCLDIGGMGLAEGINESQLVAALSGDMAGAHAQITGKRSTQNGLELDMEHHFTTNRNGMIQTQDKATLTRVENKPNTFMLEIQYKVKDAVGVYEGYHGEFHSFGLIKLDQGKVILRYKGELCKE